MALIVENGTQIPNANSYVDLAFAAEYHAVQGNDAWSGEDAALERSLVVACRALAQLFGPDLKSELANGTQERLFPRLWFTDNLGRIVTQGTVPVCWKEAQCEVALMHLNGTDVFPSEADAAVKQSSFAAGEYSESTTFYAPVHKVRYDGFRKVELLLKPILKAKPSSWRIRA